MNTGIHAGACSAFPEPALKILAGIWYIIIERKRTVTPPTRFLQIVHNATPVGLMEDEYPMRPPKQARIYQMAFSLLLIFLLASALQAAPSTTARRTQLQRRKANIQVKISNVRHQVVAARKSKQQTAYKLKGVERNLRTARSTLRVANLRVARARIELHKANMALAEAKREFITARNNAGARLLSMYERGEPGYLELVLSTDDFGEMLERAQLAKYMMDQDRAALSELQMRRDKLDKYQDRVAEKTHEVAVWQQHVAVLHNQTAMQRTTVAKKLTAQRENLAALEAELAALERDSASVTAMLRRLRNTAAGRRRYSTTYTGRVSGLPVNGHISSGFGYRIHPIHHTRRLHTGVDIGAPSGTPIHAAGGGEVVYAGWRGGYGNAVIIDHGGGRATLYGHMSSIGVRSGQVVSGRQIIGRVGSTGVSTGPHLHYELRINGTPVNPL